MFTLNQALAAIKNKPEFSVKNKDWYIVIDYNYNSKETFVGSTPEETNILLNLRGTAFDPVDGHITRLAFQKFFNLGEFPETDKQLDFSNDHVILQKLDGSLIAPIYCNGGFVWGTRDGETDVSKLVDIWLDKNPILLDKYYKFVLNYCKKYNLTPIFEFVSKENRVVIDYQETNLILTGLRIIDSGTYLDYYTMCLVAKSFDIPVVQLMGKVGDKSFDQVIKKTRNLINDEGIVIKFESGMFSGHMIKIKSLEYSNLHRAVDGLKWEHDVLKLALNNQLDDAYSIISPDLKDKVSTYVTTFFTMFYEAIRKIDLEFEKYKSIESAKEFALAIKDNKYKHFLFGLRGKVGVTTPQLVKDYCLKMCAGQTSVKEMKQFLDFNIEY